jgi:hypothetical protein
MHPLLHTPSAPSASVVQHKDNFTFTAVISPLRATWSVAHITEEQTCKCCTEDARQARPAEVNTEGGSAPLGQRRFL